MKKAWYENKSITVLLHIVVWIVLFSLPALLRPSYDPNEIRLPHPPDPGLLFIIFRINDILLIIFFYMNAFLFIPGFLYKKKYTVYLLIILSSFFCFGLIMWVLKINFTDPGKYAPLSKHLFFSAFPFLFILACSVAYKTIHDKMRADNLTSEKENTHLKTELSLLRSQVSPHFMFNILNNMVALARKRSDQLELSLLRLSSLMRYMLYEKEDEKVSLEKETEHLQNYIALQQQRFGQKVIINVTMRQSDKRYEIEPMLLIPFVENAFKHGTGISDKAQIDIDMKAEKNILSFSVSNKYDPVPLATKDDAKVIDLVNVKRRLALLYPGKHTLDIIKDNCMFTGFLQIKLV